VVEKRDFKRNEKQSRNIMVRSEIQFVSLMNYDVTRLYVIWVSTVESIWSIMFSSALRSLVWSHKVGKRPLGFTKISVKDF
jgi:hypothetical protein